MKLRHQLSRRLEVGIQAQRDFRFRDGVGHPAGNLRQRVGQIIVRLHQVWIDPQRRLILRDRIREPAWRMKERRTRLKCTPAISGLRRKAA